MELWRLLGNLPYCALRAQTANLQVCSRAITINRARVHYREHARCPNQQAAAAWQEVNSCARRRRRRRCVAEANWGRFWFCRIQLWRESGGAIHEVLTRARANEVRGGWRDDRRRLLANCCFMRSSWRFLRASFSQTQERRKSHKKQHKKRLASSKKKKTLPAISFEARFEFRV